MTGATGTVEVPWFGQGFPAPADWPADHGLPDEGPTYWGPRCCGLASIRAILAFHGMNVPPAHEILLRALHRDIYTPRGWLHRGLVELAGDYGLDGAAVGYDDPGELVELAGRGFPSIVSCAYQFPPDGSRGGHLLVFAGESRDGLPLASFMDPSAWGKAHRSAPASRFWASWSGRAILLHPATGR